MTDDIMEEAMELFRGGDLKAAVENLDGKLRSNRDNAILQHTYAEFANMLNMEEQDDAEIDVLARMAAVPRIEQLRVSICMSCSSGGEFHISE